MDRVTTDGAILFENMYIKEERQERWGLFLREGYGDQ